MIDTLPFGETSMLLPALVLALATPLEAEPDLIESATLTRPAFLAELKLTAEQTKRVAALVASIQKAPDASSAREVDQAFRKVLTPAQAARVLELQVRRRGVLAFESEAFRSRLKLDPSLAPKFEAIVKTHRERVDRATETLRNPDFAPGKPAAKRLAKGYVDEVRKIGRESLDAALKLLSAEQRSAYDRLIGAPFDLKTLYPL